MFWIFNAMCEISSNKNYSTIFRVFSNETIVSGFTITLLFAKHTLVSLIYLSNRISSTTSSVNVCVWELDLHTVPVYFTAR